MEQEEGREVEEKDRVRSDKKRHINALKHPEERGLYRKTLHSAKRLFEGIRIDTHQKKDWQKPISSSHAPLHRYLSTKSGATGRGVGTRTPTEHIPKREQPRQSNPLRFVMNPASQSVSKREIGGKLEEQSRGSIEDLDTDPVPSLQNPLGKLKTGLISKDDSTTTSNIKRNISTASSPERLFPREPDSSPPTSYKRTHSAPVTDPLSHRGSDLSSVFEEEGGVAPKLETIAEDSSLADTEPKTDHDRLIISSIVMELVKMIV